MQWNSDGSNGRDDRKLNNTVAAAAVDPSSFISIFALCTASPSFKSVVSEKPFKLASESKRLPTPIRFNTCEIGEMNLDRMNSEKEQMPVTYWQKFVCFFK